jgi:hypothetical protein
MLLPGDLTLTPLSTESASGYTEDLSVKPGRAPDNWTSPESRQSDVYAIPEAPGRKRLSPALDPIARMRLSASVKWLLVGGIILMVLGAPFFYPYVSEPAEAPVIAARHDVTVATAAAVAAHKAAARQGNSDDADAVAAQRDADLTKRNAALGAAETAFAAQHKASIRSNFAPVIASAILAAILATGLPRLLLPAFFGRWREAVEAFRDWIVVGLVTGGFYLAILEILKKIKAPASGPMASLIALNGATAQVFDPVWLTYRLPIVLLCALAGLLIARTIALRGEGIVSGNPLKGIGEVLLQAALIGFMVRPLERAFDVSGHVPLVGPLLFGLAILAIAGAVGVIAWAFDADQHATELHRRGHPVLTGIDAGDRPVPMTLSVIGGRESGKTVLMAAAYYEWLTSPFGQLRIKAAGNTGGPGAGGTDLEQVADELYVSNQFPIGTVSTQNLPFEIAHGKEAVCHFSMLDFPGGAVVGRAADQEIVREFWERLDDSDALLIIADMSYVRRGKKDPGFTQVFGAYIEAMRRLVDRNGRRRVVPIALVLTKCDEYYDPAVGRLNIDAIRKGLEEFGYAGLESAWRQMCESEGQKIVEFSTWMTSAITFSEPQRDGTGEYDYARPYRIIPPPPAIAPTGCAAPILWLTAKVMRWNVTAFRDLSSFLFGSSPHQRRRIESILEMERVAEQKRVRS